MPYQTESEEQLLLSCKERAESNRFKDRQGEEVLAVLPGIWKVSLLFYVATIFDKLREDSSALPTIYNYSYHSFNSLTTNYASRRQNGRQNFFVKLVIKLL